MTAIRILLWGSRQVRTGGKLVKQLDDVDFELSQAGRHATDLLHFRSLQNAQFHYQLLSGNESFIVRGRYPLLVYLFDAHGVDINGSFDS
jgi:hypothetical protein